MIPPGGALAVQEPGVADGLPTPSDAAYRDLPAPAYAILWLDLQGRVTRWSDHAVALFGYSLEEAVGMHFSELHSADDRSAGRPAVALAMARDLGSADETGWRRSRSGRVFWAASSITLVRTPNELEIGYLVVTRDLTNVEVVADVGVTAHPTAGLLSVGRVAADAAHELNNLLAAARGFAGVLERHLPEHGLPREAWRELVKTCDRGAGIVRKILEVGRPADEGLEAVDLASVVRNVQPLLQQVLPSRILLVTSLPVGLPRVVARPRDIDLALLNLVVNARDAIVGDGSIAISVQLDDYEARGEARVSLCVRDSGVGMPPEVQGRVFDRFFTTKGPSDGTGLGLALVREALEACGGEVDLASTKGFGTRVDLRFRVAEPVRATVSEPVPGVITSSPQVVMVWAGAPTDHLLAGLLCRAGYAVVEVRNDAQARRVLAERGAAIALVVLGGQLDELEGASVMRALEVETVRPPTIVLGEIGPAAPWGNFPCHPGDRILSGALAPERILEEIDLVLQPWSRMGQRTAIH